MYIQENLTTTPHEIPGISWEVPPELEGRLAQYGAFARLVTDGDRLLDIEEDAEKRARFEQAQARERAAREAQAAAQAQAAREAQAAVELARLSFRTQAADLDADSVIRCRALAGEWEPGPYTAGEVRLCGGVPYRCCQAHDSTGNAGWGPADAPALWAAYHGTGPETALPWTRPSGAHDLYRKGECMIWTDGRILRALEDTAYSPQELEAAWEEVS